jgi:hypothetical protein
LTFPAIAPGRNQNKCLGLSSPYGSRYFPTSAQNSKEEIQMQISIDIKVLTFVSSMKEEKARQVIAQTTKVMINGELIDGELIDVNPVEETITVEVPTDLGDGPLVIVLVNKEGETVAPLLYDQEAGEFPPKEEDGDQGDPYEEIVEAIGKLADPVIKDGFANVVAAIGSLTDPVIKEGFVYVAAAIEKSRQKRAGRGRS